MNKVVLMGRLTKDPEVRYSSGAKNTEIANFCIAVERKFQKGQSDFINCVAFAKTAELIEKYFKKGSKILITGSIQTGSYTNKDGQKVYTTNVSVEDIEFVDSKNSNQDSGNNQEPYSGSDNDFVNIPENISEELPFS